MKFTNALFVWLVMLVHVVAASAQEAPSANETWTLLRSDDLEVQEKTLMLMARQRNTVVEELIKLAKDAELRKKNPFAILCAVELLGQYRAIEAVPVLLDVLDFPRVDEEGGIPGNWRVVKRGLYIAPAKVVIAFQRIGNVATPQIVKRLENVEEGPVLFNLLNALKCIEGEINVVAILEEAIQKSDSEDAKKRLSNAVIYFKKSKDFMHTE